MVDTLASDGGQLEDASACDLMLKPFLYELTPLDYPPPPSPYTISSPLRTTACCPKEDILSSAFNMTLLGPDLIQPLSETEFTQHPSLEDLNVVVGQPLPPSLADQQQQQQQQMFPVLAESGEPGYGTYYAEYEDFGYQERHPPFNADKFIPFVPANDIFFSSYTVSFLNGFQI